MRFRGFQGCSKEYRDIHRVSMRVTEVFQISLRGPKTHSGVLQRGFRGDSHIFREISERLFQGHSG